MVVLRNLYIPYFLEQIVKKKFVYELVLDFIIHIQGGNKKDANVLQKKETAIHSISNTKQYIKILQRI